MYICGTWPNLFWKQYSRVSGQLIWCSRTDLFISRFLCSASCWSMPGDVALKPAAVEGSRHRCQSTAVKLNKSLLRYAKSADLSGMWVYLSVIFYSYTCQLSLRPCISPMGQLSSCYVYIAPMSLRSNQVINLESRPKHSIQRRVPFQTPLSNFLWHL